MNPEEIVRVAEDLAPSATKAAQQAAAKLFGCTEFTRPMLDSSADNAGIIEVGKLYLADLRGTALKINPKGNLGPDLEFPKYRFVDGVLRESPSAPTINWGPEQYFFGQVPPKVQLPKF